MAKSCGRQLPAALLEKLLGGLLYRSGSLGLPVLTVDDDGWPHVAMAAGAVAVQPDRVWFTLGAATGSMERARRTGRVTLMIAGPETLYYVKGTVEAVHTLQSVPGEAAVSLAIQEVLHDTKPFLRIAGGITYAWNLMPEEYQTVIGGLLDELEALAKGTA